MTDTTTRRSSQVHIATSTRSGLLSAAGAAFTGTAASDAGRTGELGVGSVSVAELAVKFNWLAEAAAMGCRGRTWSFTGKSVDVHAPAAESYHQMRAVPS